MRFGMVVLILVGVLASSTITLAETSAWADPPARPLKLTASQFGALRQLETQAQHAAILDVHATYKSERERSLDFTRASDDFWTVVYQGMYPSAIAFILLTSL